MLKEVDSLQTSSIDPLEYYKVMCTLPYSTHPLFAEEKMLKEAYFQLLCHYTLLDPTFSEYKQPVRLLYQQMFEVSDLAGPMDQKALFRKVNRMYYKYERPNFQIYTYKYLFFAHCLLLRYGLLDEEDPLIQEMIQRARLRIDKKDARTVVQFTNALKSGDTATAYILIQARRFKFLSFFHKAFRDYYSYYQSKQATFLVVGTMSAGKSTFLNSIAGKDLFPSQNEACTSKVYRYINRPLIEHFIVIRNNNNSFTCLFDLTEKDLHAWNEADDITSIQLESSLSSYNSIGRYPVSFIDTPGTNNSMDHTHSQITADTIKANGYDTILYLINATQLATEDDKYLLGLVNEHVSEHPDKEVVFVVNKVDELDEDSGEFIEDFADHVEAYLKKNGFEQPRIIFTSALAAKLAQMVLMGETLTRKERSQFSFYYELLAEEQADLTQYARGMQKSMPVTSIEGQVTVQNQTYEISKIYRMLHHSGINQMVHLI